MVLDTFPKGSVTGSKAKPCPAAAPTDRKWKSKKNDECFTKTTRNFLIDLWGLHGGSRQRSLVLEVDLCISLKLATLPCKNAPSEAKLFKTLIRGGLERRKCAHLPCKIKDLGRAWGSTAETK